VLIPIAFFATFKVTKIAYKILGVFLHIIRYHKIDTEKTPKYLNEKSEKLASQNLQPKKNNCDHLRQKCKKRVIFKTFFGFSILDIFKNVQNPFPF
jgi:hypothetical protein